LDRLGVGQLVQFHLALLALVLVSVVLVERDLVHPGLRALLHQAAHQRELVAGACGVLGVVHSFDVGLGHGGEVVGQTQLVELLLVLLLGLAELASLRHHRQNADHTEHLLWSDQALRH